MIADTVEHPNSRERTPTPRQETLSQPPQEVVQRSRWQTILLEAGGISAAYSEDNMRRLKYCLQWLQVLVHLHNLADLPNMGY